MTLWQHICMMFEYNVIGADDMGTCTFVVLHNVSKIKYIYTIIMFWFIKKHKYLCYYGYHELYLPKRCENKLYLIFYLKIVKVIKRYVLVHRTTSNILWHVFFLAFQNLFKNKIFSQLIPKNSQDQWYLNNINHVFCTLIICNSKKSFFFEKCNIIYENMLYLHVIYTLKLLHLYVRYNFSTFLYTIAFCFEINHY